MYKKLLVAATAAWLLATLAPAVAAPAVHDTAQMLAQPGLVKVEGSSVNLVVTNDRARITVNTSGLIAGNVYTLWGFTFSSPENCDGDCGMDDMARADVGFAVQQVAGHVTGASGNVNLAGSIAVANALGAEYHIAIAEHGALDPETMPEQIKTGGPVVQIGFLGD